MEQIMNTRKNKFLWVLYDFANSLVAIVFFLYFSQWIVVDRGVSDLWFNLTFTMAALILLVTVPVTGVLLDKYWRRIAGLRYTTFGTVLFYGLCAIFAVNGQNVPALITFTLGLYFYLLSFSFYTPLLNDIARPSERGRISGYGIAANYLGQIAGLLLVLPFAQGQFSLFGSLPRTETLLPSVIVFLIFALPVLLFFKESPKPDSGFSLKAEIKSATKVTKELFTYSGILSFLIAYFLFNDAILTAANNFAIFLEQVWQVSDTVKTYLMLGILATSSLGGLISGLAADRVGHKKTLIFILSGWIFIFPFIALVSNFSAFIAGTILMGFWFGANWTVSRSVMAYLSPNNRHNLAFGLFGLVERASSFIGPVTWGLMVSNFQSMGSSRYRVAAGVLTIFIILGLIFLKRVPSDKIANAG